MPAQENQESNGRTAGDRPTISTTRQLLLFQEEIHQVLQLAIGDSICQCGHQRLKARHNEGFWILDGFPNVVLRP